MDFSLNDDQRMLKDTVDRLVAHGLRLRAAQGSTRSRPTAGAARSGRAWPRSACWRCRSRGARRARRRAVDTMLVMESLGRALALEPLLSSTVICAGGAVAAGERRSSSNAGSQRIAAGELTVAWAHGEAQSRYRLSDVACTADAQRRRSAGCSMASRPLVRTATAPTSCWSARASPASGATATASRCSWSMPMRRASRGAAVRTHDGLRAADVAFAEVRVGAADAIGEPGKALPHHRARGRTRHRRARRRSGRRDERGARDDSRVPEDAPPVRRADRPLPGAAAPRRRDADRGRTGAQHGDVRAR